VTVNRKFAACPERRFRKRGRIRPLKVTDEKTYNVLFLCTGNSARSIIAESVLNRIGAGRFKAYSAGSQPSGQIHPFTAQLLTGLNFKIDDARSKSWNEFATDGAPEMDFVFTVCDNAAGEVCPIWPGQPVTAHWPFPDPAAFDGSEAEHHALFVKVYGMIEKRINSFVNLPVSSLDKHTLQIRLEEIGQDTSASAEK